MGLEWNAMKTELPPEINMLGAPKLVWNKGSGQLGQPSYDECFAQDPNFNGCWQDMFRQAQIECQQSTSPYGSYDACVNARARANANQVCIPACEAYLRGGGDFPWGVRSDATCEVQREINIALADPNLVVGRKAAGTTYRPIAEDCVMGPATCGALDFLGQGTPASCQGRPWTTPVPTGTPGPSPIPVPSPPVGGGRKKSSAGLGLLAGASLLAIVGALVSAGR